MSKVPLYLQHHYIEKKKEQTLRWVMGYPEHDDMYQECCPDFSCCVPSMFTEDDEKRKREGNELLKKLQERQHKGVNYE